MHGEPAEAGPPNVDLPPPTPELLWIGSLALALERRFPGLNEEVQELVDSEFMRSRHVVSIRPPKDWPMRQKALAALSAHLSRVMLVADAYVGWRKRRKREE